MNDWQGTAHVASDLAADINRITGRRPQVSNQPKSADRNAVIPHFRGIEKSEGGGTA